MDNDSAEIMADGVWLMERATKSTLRPPSRPDPAWLQVLGLLDQLADSAIDAILAWYDERPPAARDAKRLAAFRVALAAMRDLDEGDIEDGDDCVIGNLRGVLKIGDVVHTFGVEMRDDAEAWAAHLTEYLAKVESQSVREALS